MIKSFANQESEEIYHGIHTHTIRKDLSSFLLKVAERRMDILNCVDSLEDLALCLPAYKGEVGVRDGHGKYSIPIDDPYWRITFRWDNKDAFDVEVKK